MERNCFAFKEIPLYGHPEYTTYECAALKEMLCAKDGECPFCKTRERLEMELTKRHGTSDLKVICEEYARIHGN